jgi:aminoglycoside phosphotransferase (APT) family kinase protein
MRPEAIEALTQSEFVRITPAQQELVARATPQERQVAALAIAHAREARRLLEELGVLKVPSVLDVTREDVHCMQKRADALSRAMLELGESWQDRVPLGQALKTAQRERARAAVRILREGGHREVDDLTVAE